jgi:hypothetical protein
MHTLSYGWLRVKCNSVDFLDKIHPALEDEVFSPVEGRRKKQMKSNRDDFRTKNSIIQRRKVAPDPLAQPQMKKPPAFYWPVGFFADENIRPSVYGATWSRK